MLSCGCYWLSIDDSCDSTSATMAAAAVLQWKSAVKHLQQLTADLSNKRVVDSATSELLGLCDEVSSSGVPSATVKKLVTDVKVCPCLAAVALGSDEQSCLYLSALCFTHVLSSGNADNPC